MPSSRSGWVLLVLAATAQSVGAAQEQGARGIAAARRGGVVIVCRHGITPSSAVENEQTLRYDDPATQRRLSEEGERQAADIGKAFRALGISVAEVIASPMQRAARTAELAFGQVQRDSAWHTRGEDYTGWKHDRRLAALSGAVTGGDRVIVSHIGTIYSMLPSIRGELNEGDCVVIRPEGGGQYQIIEVVPWRAWVEAARIKE